MKLVLIIILFISSVVAASKRAIPLNLNQINGYEWIGNSTSIVEPGMVKNHFDGSTFDRRPAVLPQK